MSKERDKKGRWVLVGNLSEFVEYDNILESEPPLKLNLAEIQSVNSIGALKFLNALKSYDGKVELHRCSRSISDMMGMLGRPRDGRGRYVEVVSCLMLYVCMVCARNFQVGVKCGHAFDVHGRFVLPSPKCPGCRESMVPTEDIEDILHFLIED